MYAAIEAAVHSTTSVVRNWRIWFILTSAICAATICAPAAEPPSDLIRRVIARETKTAKVQANYTYRQSVNLSELNNRGSAQGEYREVRDIIFSPRQERTEQLVGKPSNTLAHLQLT